MKSVKLTCPNCGRKITYKNRFMWVLDTPFHWFGKRLTYCMQCGKYNYMKKENDE